jgi:copper resistance protein B
LRARAAAAGALAAVLLAAPAGAQQHSGHGAGAAGDMAAAQEALYRENGGQRLGGVRLDLAEAGAGAPGGDWRVEASAWTGGDIDRARVRLRAEPDSAEAELAWVHAFDPWWNLQAGAGKDLAGDGDAYLMAGIEGLAPYWIHASADLRLSDRGRLGAHLEAATDQRITRRLILQPRLEAGLGIDGGVELHEAEAGLRLRYEIRPEFAPYVGWVWSRREAGAHSEAAETGAGLVAGLTAWF